MRKSAGCTVGGDADIGAEPRVSGAVDDAAAQYDDVEPLGLRVQGIGGEQEREEMDKGIEIIEGLRGHITGLAVPTFAVDAPGGGGKVPINPGYILYHDHEKIVIRNYEGKIFEYPETGADPSAQFAPQRQYHDEYLYS